MSERNDRQLVLSALGMAYFRRRPAHGLIHHSDRGSVYCSRDYRKLLEHYGMHCSMSRKANCYDNAPMQKLVQDAQGRARQPTSLSHARAGALGRVLLHRDFLQYAATSFVPGLRLAERIRAPLRGEGGSLKMFRVLHRRPRSRACKALHAPGRGELYALTVGVH